MNISLNFNVKILSDFSYFNGVENICCLLFFLFIFCFHSLSCKCQILLFLKKGNLKHQGVLYENIYKIQFLNKFGPKNQNCQCKVKFCTQTNSNMQNSMVMFFFSVFDQRYQPRPQCIFLLHEEGEKEATERFKYVTKI